MSKLEFRLYVSIDKNSYPAKPDEYQIRVISKRIAANPVDLSLTEFNNFVTSGIGYIGGHFEDGQRRDSGWLYSNSMSLDFDNTAFKKSTGHLLTPDEAISRCKMYGIEPFLVYHTYSSTDECPMFRMVFAFDGIISSKALWKHGNKTLTTILHECDKSSCKVSQFYFGGLREIHYNDAAIIPLENLLPAYAAYCEDHDGIQAVARTSAYTKRFAELLFTDVDASDLVRAFQAGTISVFASPYYSRTFMHDDNNSRLLENLLHRLN